MHVVKCFVQFFLVVLFCLSQSLSFLFWLKSLRFQTKMEWKTLEKQKIKIYKIPFPLKITRKKKCVCLDDSSDKWMGLKWAKLFLWNFLHFITSNILLRLGVERELYGLIVLSDLNCFVPFFQIFLLGQIKTRLISSEYLKIIVTEPKWKKYECINWNLG